MTHLQPIYDKSLLHSLTPERSIRSLTLVFSEQTAEACANSWLHQWGFCKILPVHFLSGVAIDLELGVDLTEYERRSEYSPALDLTMADSAVGVSPRPERVRRWWLTGVSAPKSRLQFGGKSDESVRELWQLSHGFFIRNGG